MYEEAETSDEQIPQPPYKSELEVLVRHRIPFARRPSQGGMAVSSLLLTRRCGGPVLYLGPKGWRADLRAVARQLQCSHLRLAWRLQQKDLICQPPARLSPLGLGFYDLDPLYAAVDRRLLDQPALGFPLGRGRLAWLEPECLMQVLDLFGCGLVFGHFARKPQAMAGPPFAAADTRYSPGPCSRASKG